MKLVYIPLDERPCNYHFAEKIARGTPIELRRPAREILGNKKTPADFSRLRAFMLENASRADGYVVSLDMLLYGGIVPSRLHHLSREELTQRLAVLDEIKAINPTAQKATVTTTMFGRTTDVEVEYIQIEKLDGPVPEVTETTEE